MCVCKCARNGAQSWCNYAYVLARVCQGHLRCKVPFSFPYFFFLSSSSFLFFLCMRLLLCASACCASFFVHPPVTPHVSIHVRRICLYLCTYPYAVYLYKSHMPVPIYLSCFGQGIRQVTILRSGPFQWRHWAPWLVRKLKFQEPGSLMPCPLSDCAGRSRDVHTLYSPHSPASHLQKPWLHTPRPLHWLTQKFSVTTSQVGPSRPSKTHGRRTLVSLATHLRKHGYNRDRSVGF